MGKQIIIIIAVLLLSGVACPPVTAGETVLAESPAAEASNHNHPGGSLKTITDSSGRKIVFHKPINRIIPLSVNSFEVMRSLKATDRVVGVSVHIANDSFYYPGFQNLPNIGDRFSINYEMLLVCRPDLIIASTTTRPSELDDKLAGTGINIVRFDFNSLETYEKEVANFAYLLDKTDEAEVFLKFYHTKMEAVKDLIGRIPVNERPKVFLEADFGGGQNYATCGTGHAYHKLLDAAGGLNIFSHISFYSGVSPEAVMEENPRIIIKYRYPAGHIDRKKEDVDDLKAIRDEILSRIELVNVDAVRNKQVYVFDWFSTRGAAQYFLCLPQLAKWLYPDKFKDLNPRADYEEYLKKFQGLYIDLNVYGVFFYPEL